MEPGQNIVHNITIGGGVVKQIEVVPRFQIEGKKYTMEQLPPEEVDKIVKERIDLGMQGIRYERQKTA